MAMASAADMLGYCSNTSTSAVSSCSNTVTLCSSNFATNTTTPVYDHNTYIYYPCYVSGTGSSTSAANVISDYQYQQMVASQQLQLHAANRATQADAVRMAEIQRQQAAAEQQVQAAVAARERAKALLLEHLTQEQRETFERNGWFVVEGGKSKTQYRINPNAHAGNVTQLKKDKAEWSYCGHIDYRYPAYDNALAQKLLLEADEKAFLKVANRRAA
jgi:hypothetical protein